MGCKKWTFPQRKVHYVQYQFFLFYILLIWGCVRTQRTPLPTGLTGRSDKYVYRTCDLLLITVRNNASSVASVCNTRSSAIAEGPRDALCQLKSCQLPRNSAETTCATSPKQIEVMKLEV